MNNSNTTIYDVTGGNKLIDLIGGLRSEPFALCQIVTNGAYDGNTDTITLQESANGTDWNDIIDNLGNPLTIILNASNSSFVLKTTIFLGLYVKANFVKGDSTAGTLTLTTVLKGNF